MNKKELCLNEQDDSLLVAAVTCAETLNLEEQGRALWEGPSLPVSEALEARVRECFRAYERKQAAEERRQKAATRKARRRKLGRKLFTLVSILTMLACALYMTVGAFRTKVNNVAQGFSDGIASIIIQGNATEKVTKLAYGGKVPSGFTCVQNSLSPAEDYARYEKYVDNFTEDVFTYVRQAIVYTETGIGISVIESVAYETTINNCPAQIGFTGDKMTVVEWYSEANLYYIISTLDAEMVLEMAETVPTV